VLANEEVLDGKSINPAGFPVERRPMRQWMLRITAYADRLLEDLELLDWPESLKEMQRNWIGKSIGADVDFEIAPPDLHVQEIRGTGGLSSPSSHEIRGTGGLSSSSSDVASDDDDDLTISVFTTRPDTLFGATYMVLAPEHPLVDRITVESHRE